MPPTEAALLVIQLARAVHHAHQHGVLHRDLKPGNFLFMEDGRACVSDFGLAKLTVHDQSPLTRTESFFGTPHYMPPEVAAGSVSDATVAGDLYSMGAVFYECLTGRRPHASRDNVAAQLRAIADDPVTPPAGIHPQVPADLSVICMKALERQPRDRYASLEDFAADTQRWLDGRPIQARPVGRMETAWRWAARHPLSAGLIAALFGVVFVGTILLAVSHGQRGAALLDARKQLQRSLIDQARSERLLGAPGHRARALAHLRQAAGLAQDPQIRDEAAALLARPDLSPVEAADNEAANCWASDLIADDRVATWRISPTGQAGLAFHQSGTARLWRKDQTTPAGEWAAADGNEIAGEFSPNGQSLVLAGTAAGTLLVNPAKPSPPRLLALPGPTARFLTIDPAGRKVALARVDGLEVLDLAAPAASWHHGDAQARCAAAWSADGTRIAAAVGDRREAVILAADNGEVCITAAVTGLPQHLAFHPGGDLLAIASDDGAIALCETSTGATWSTLQLPANSLVFSPDGKHLLAGSGDGQLRSWAVNSPVGLREWPEAPRGKSDGAVHGMEISPDGTRLLTISTGCLAVWSVTDQRQTGCHLLENQRIDVRAAAWWLDDHEILLQVPGGLEKLPVNANGTTRTAIRLPKVPGSRVLGVRPDGGWIVSVSDDEGNQSCELWPGGNPDQAQRGIAPPEPAGPITTSHPASGAAADWTDAGVIVVRKADGWTLRLIPPLNPGGRALRFTRDGKELLLLTRTHRVFSTNLEILSRALDDLGL